MKQKLDHFYGNTTGSAVDLGPINQQITAIDTKITNLSNIAVKNNLQNQVLPQQKINQAPTDRQHIIRLEDEQFVRIVLHEGNTAANTVLQFTMRNNELKNARLHTFRIKCAANGVDYVWETGGWIEDRNYKNCFPIVSFSNTNNFNETAKFNFWVESSAIKIYASIPLSSVSVYLKVENHR